MFDSNCYFCHGYRGDAQTAAAKMLNPPPLNFWRAENLTVERVEKAVRFGRKGTAMPSFAARLSDEEIAAVAVYVTSGLTAGGAYHTTENGWPDHAQRNGAAFPFVRGEISVDAPPEALKSEERAGLALFRSTCAVCHDGESDPSRAGILRRVEAGATPAAAPTAVARSADESPAPNRRRTGDCSRCHDDFDSRGNPLSRRAAEAAYGPGPHDVIPEIAGLTPKERRGRDLYQAACADCHAADGTGANWVGNFLETSPTDFSSPAYSAGHDHSAFIASVLAGPRNSSMPKFSAVLTTNQADDIAAYVERAFVRD